MVEGFSFDLRCFLKFNFKKFGAALPIPYQNYLLALCQYRTNFCPFPNQYKNFLFFLKLFTRLKAHQYAFDIETKPAIPPIIK